MLFFIYAMNREHGQLLSPIGTASCIQCNNDMNNNFTRKLLINIFFVHGIHNIAPVIAGSLLGKKVYWFILETPSNLLIIIFKIFRLFF